jgi:hypothetical protein
MDGLLVEESEKWGRDTARQRYGECKHEDGVEWATPVDNKPQKLNDPTNLQAPEHYYNNDASGWVRAEGEDAMRGKGNFDYMKRPSKVAGSGQSFATNKEQPSSYHAHDDYGREGGGRGEPTTYEPPDTRQFWAKERR